MRYNIFTEAIKFVRAEFAKASQILPGEFELDQLAQVSQISLGRVLQATNTSSSIKKSFSPPSLPLNPPLTPQPPPPPPLTTDDCHEPPLLAVRPPHREEQFNQSRIFKTHLEDLIENEASNPSFTVSSR